MARADEAALLSVTVACSPADGRAEECRIELPAGATLIDALRASGVLERHPTSISRVRRSASGAGSAPLDAPLKEGDRVEIYRPLQVDPKEARRRRQRLQQGATCSLRR
jgi:putative ubiquitin-RnfH superfamily antitoxin RatB of RatAB toxin-antitoxin module